ncbi:extracellular solute-binding protein [Microlunatus speluncae]|uniref:extracellular solute-binding protein n=1 Tax=Microlunatus speluncae TaxID=2594267 RepID=UPI00126633E2|nr:extracellular solute-binding protein [Microlunatus speluncae]
MTTIQRRTVLGALGGAGAAALAGCSPGSDQAPGGTATEAAVALPTYAPYQGVKPDLPASTAGVEAGFLRYPAEPVTGLTEKPGTGGPVVAMASNPGPIPPSADRNRYLQAMSEFLNVDLNLQLTTVADYTSKLSTVVAGGDLPDILQLYGIPRIPDLLEARFADLTEHVSGDAVNDYPFLANIPTDAWRTCVFNGRLYGLPIHRAAVGPIMYSRADLLEAKGLNGQPKDFAEFKQLCLDLTDARANRWACATPNGVKIFIQQMLGVASPDWSEDGGRLTHIAELEQTEQAIGLVAELWQAGVFHPDSLGGSVDVRALFVGDTTPLIYNNYTVWSGYAQQLRATDPEVRLAGMLPPGFDAGSTSCLWKGNPSYSTVAIKQGEPGRVAELLRIANVLAAPFGTTEYLQVKYGVEGVHYTMDGSEPTPTETGTLEATGVINYLGSPPAVLYDPGLPEVTEQQHAYQERAIPISKQTPVLGHHSPSQGSEGAQLSALLEDTQNEIFQGRKPITEWKATVDRWRKQGGDKIRTEYEESLARNR